jgi:hypothetical protein
MHIALWATCHRSHIVRRFVNANVFWVEPIFRTLQVINHVACYGVIDFALICRGIVINILSADLIYQR